jgi:hypothetical protein
MNEAVTLAFKGTSRMSGRSAGIRSLHIIGFYCQSFKGYLANVSYMTANTKIPDGNATRGIELISLERV